MKKIGLSMLILLLTATIAFSGCSAKGKTVNMVPEQAFERVVWSAYGYMFLAVNGDIYTYGKTDDDYDMYFLGIKDVKRNDVPTKIFSGAVKICENLSMPAAITRNGDLYVWGHNGKNRELGFDTDVEIVWEPTKLMEDVADVGYGYALKTNGELWVWGIYGNLNPSTGKYTASLPQKKMDNVVKYVQCAGIGYAIKTDGTLWARGYYEKSSRGNGKTCIDDSAYDKPVKILDNVADISMGEYHVLALKTDGTLWAWGGNEYGQVGNGENGDLSEMTVDCVVTEPVKIMEHVASIQTCEWESLAITENGDLYGWGKNYGCFADVNIESVNAPKFLLSNVNTVYNKTLSRIFALTNDGKLWSWGKYGYGALGTECSYEFERLGEAFGAEQPPAEQYCYEPTLVIDGVESILGGYDLMFAKMADGTYRYWGMDTYKTVKTYGEANYVEFLESGVYGSSCWYEGMTRTPDFPPDAAIPGAVMHRLEVIKYPTECAFPPYIGDD